MGAIKKITGYLLRKGFGVLKTNVFVVKTTTKLNQITISDDVILHAIDERVLNDISGIRGKKKYAQLKKIRDNGGYGFSLYKANELAAYGWVALNNEEKRQRMLTEFAIPPNSAHIFECYTVDKFRGQKLYQAIVYNLVEWAKNRHADKVYIDTVIENDMAQKGIINLGFEYISAQTKIILFSKTIFEYDNRR